MVPVLLLWCTNRGEGGQPGNGNAKKGIVLPDGLKLETSDEILTFMREILITYTLAGKIGTRQSSAIDERMWLQTFSGRMFSYQILDLVSSIHGAWACSQDLGLGWNRHANQTCGFRIHRLGNPCPAHSHGI